MAICRAAHTSVLIGLPSLRDPAPSTLFYAPVYDRGHRDSLELPSTDVPMSALRC